MGELDVQSWEEYQQKASVTAIYPGRESFLGLTYVISGLPDEACELLEVAGDSKKRMHELSDVFWYFVQTAHELDVQLQDIIEESNELEAQFKTFHIRDAIDQIVIAAGKINGVFKKYIRDDYNENKMLSEEKKLKIRFHLSCMMCGMLNLCRFLGCSWQDVAKINLEKLYSRKDRGKLGGSGDDR